MSTQPDQSEATSPAGLRGAWRTAVGAVRTANRVTHHALSWLLVLVLVAYFAFCAMFLGLRYLVLPNIDRYKPEVSELVSEALQRPVTIHGIHANWSGLFPRLQLDDVVIHNDQGERALQLPQVNVTVSWLSLLGQLRLHSLELLRPDLEIERDPQGVLYVAGMRIDTGRPDDGHGLDWLLAQHEILIRGGTLRWHDQLRKAPPLDLKNIDFVLRNRWRSHKAALRATPPDSLAGPIDLRIDFVHPALSGSRSDFSQWQGELYADWRDARLDGWKPYLDLPWQLEGGEGALRAWLRFDRGVLQDVTADLDLRNLSATLGEGLQPLQLLEVGGRISAGETGTGLKEKLFSFGEHGHVLTLTDFSLRTEQGAVLPRTTVSHRYAAGTARHPERHELKVTELDLEALAALATHLPLPPDERRLLDNYAPRGMLKNFAATWDGSLPGNGNFKVGGNFERLTLRQQLATGSAAAVPGFDGLSGDIDATQDGGRLRIRSQRSTLYLAGYLNESTLFFDDLAFDGSWTFRANRSQLALKIAGMEFLQAGLRGHAEGSHVLPWPLAAGKLGELDLRAHFPEVELTRVAGYLPAIVGTDTRDWMNRGILDGRAQDVNLTIRGNLDKFPFVPRRGAASDGVFRLAAKLSHARLSPAPQELAADRRTLLWPRIEEIEGQLTLDRTRLAIHADSAKTQGVALSAVDVVIPDLLADRPLLDVAGTASGSLPTMLAYVNATPIAGWIGNLTDETRATGSARTTLKMQLPLTDGGQPSVQGSVRLSGNEVQLLNSLPPVQQLVGDIGFSDHGFQLNGLQGNMLGGPVSFTGGTQRDGSTAVRLDGAFTVDGIARFVPGASAKRLVRKLSGATRYAANVKVRNQRLDFTLESSLAGVAIDLPAPLQKTASETLPLRVAISPVGVFDNATQSEEIRVNLGRAISARYLRQRPARGNANWRLTRGAIAVNSTPAMLDSGVSIAVNLSTLNLDAWRRLAAELDVDNAAADAGSGMSPAAFVTPESVSLRARELTFGDRTINNAVVGASHVRGGWQFNLSADEIAGRATWEDPAAERGAGKLSARLSLLKIQGNDASDVTDILAGKKAFSELPGLDIVADSFELRGLKLGRLELGATNATLSSGSGREWRISRLALSNPGANMRATGRWVTGQGEGQTQLNYELDILDAGQLLDRLGFEKAVRGGKGSLEGELSWRGDPTMFDFPSLSGSLSLKLGSGQFLKADPGVAKLLGVMSLQSLPRRLTLDFRDVFSKGFEFESIASTATIGRGVLKTDSFKMRGPAAVVLMDGTVDLAEETQNLGVVVIPELNAGGASVVYGLAVNPVIGLGSFLAQYLLKSPLSAALTQEYQVTGPWKDPVIKKVPVRRNKVAGEQDKAGTQ